MATAPGRGGKVDEAFEENPENDIPHSKAEVKRNIEDTGVKLRGECGSRIV